MAIVPKDFPGGSLTEENAARIEGAVLEAIDSVDPQVVVPQFNGSKLIEGALNLWCADSATMGWVLEKFNKESGKDFYALPHKDLPRPVSVMTWVPGVPVQKPEDILRRICLQNKNLNTVGWRVTGTKPDPKGQQIFFSIPSKDAKHLEEELKFKVHLGLSRVTFKILGKKEGTSSKSGQQGVADKPAEPK